MKKKKKTKYFIVAVALVLVITGTISAYLKESDSLYNLFTVGKAKVDIDEGDFPQNKVISPGQSSEKAPKAVNKGTIDEYVFMEVTLAQREISVLDDVTKAPGEDANSNPNPKKEQSLFLTGVTAPNTGTAVLETVEGVEKTYDDFWYNTTEDTSNGKWVFLKTEYTAAVAASGAIPAKDASRKFIFGYSRKLAPEEKTNTIFDTVTLKRFIEEGVEGGTSVQIDVNALCIQADNLDGHSISEPLDQTELLDIYNICKNKGLGTE